MYVAFIFKVKIEYKPHYKQAKTSLSIQLGWRLITRREIA